MAAQSNNKSNSASGLQQWQPGGVVVNEWLKHFMRPHSPLVWSQSANFVACLAALFTSFPSTAVKHIIISVWLAASCQQFVGNCGNFLLIMERCWFISRPQSATCACTGNRTVNNDRPPLYMKTAFNASFFIKTQLCETELEAD